MKGFLTAAERLGSFEEIRRNLAEGVTPMLATGLSQIHKVHFAWALTGGSRLVLTPDEPAAVRMARGSQPFLRRGKGCGLSHPGVLLPGGGGCIPGI